VNKKLEAGLITGGGLICGIFINEVTVKKTRKNHNCQYCGINTKRVKKYFALVGKI
jgi:hypothetical protein